MTHPVPGVPAVPDTVVRRSGWLVVAVGGVVACLLSFTLRWHDLSFQLAAWTRLVMAISGAALLVVVATRTGGRPLGASRTVGLLGVGVVAYPSVLAVAAAGLGQPVSGVVAGGWHILPLTLVQLAPVVASTSLTGRRARRWEWTVLAFAAASTGSVAIALASGAGDSPWTTISTLIFFASFLLAPLATWTAVAGTSGETRRRAVLAAVGSIVPVVIILGCTALGLLTTAVGASEDRAITILLVGFSVGALLCGLAVTATAAPAGSSVLRTRFVVVALDGLIAIVVVIAGSVAALVLPADRVPPGGTLLAGAVIAAVLILPWLRLHAWIVRVVDPSEELRHELSLIGEVGDGQQRGTVLRLLRRLLDDPGLGLAFRVGDAWVDADGRSESRSPEAAITLAVGDSGPAVVGWATNVEAAARLTSLGDITPLVRSALLEAAVVHESARAARAAEEERRQVERDLHDGLQGRLLGLALNLQLSAGAIEDPTTRLLLDETVDSLRSTVEDLRSFGSGRHPETLAHHGLAPALASLFRHARPVVGFDVPPVRFPAEAEKAAYFVVGEAVTNALKHAQAEHVDVRIRMVDGTLAVTVSDDGCGGADPRLGSGLRGLAERVAATGGALVVREGRPTGTVVEALVPCAS